MGIRRERREKRREEILEAALELFVSKGYAETKISDIAEKVNMSVGLLFHYFESKASLYEELIWIGVKGPLTVMEPDERDPVRFLEGAAAYILSGLKENKSVARMFVFMTQVRLSSSIPESVRDMVREQQLLEKTVDIVKKGQAAGQIRPGNPEALSVLFWQSLSGVALYAAFYPDAPLPKAEWIVDGLRKKIGIHAVDETKTAGKWKN